MSVQTEITRIESAKTAIATAIEGKGVTVPEGTKLDGMAALVEAISAGASIRVEQGSVTFAENTSLYTFVSDSPDIFIAYVENDTKPVYSSSKFVWAFFQDTRKHEYHGRQENTMFVFGYNSGSQKYYTPFKGKADPIGRYSNAMFNGFLGPTTYKWYAIYGVTAT